MEAIALSGVIGALSYALDITEGQPPGHALRSCMIGMRLAEELSLPARDRSDLFYALLLKDAGCSANAERMAALFGTDDQAAKRTAKLADWSSARHAFTWSLRTVAPGGSLRRRAGYLRAIRDEGDVTRKLMAARCDSGAEIATMLDLTAARLRRSARSTSTGTGADARALRRGRLRGADRGPAVPRADGAGRGARDHRPCRAGEARRRRPRRAAAHARAARGRRPRLR